MSENVTVIGTGRMGSALATALFNRGFATTVWNRTASKTEPLTRLGLRAAQTVLEAVSQADIVFVNINNYATTRQILEQPQIQPALRGKILMQLSTGTPDEARQMESWARRGGISYLDGAIVGSPSSIVKSQGTALYSGSEELFQKVKPVLLSFGPNALFVGKEIGHASALDVAVLAFGVSSMLGFLQGYVVCEAEKLPAETYLQFATSLLPVLQTILGGFYKTIQENDFDKTEASLEAYAACPRELIEWCRAHRVDHSVADAQLALFDKAIQAGKSQSDFAYLYQVLKAG